MNLPFSWRLCLLFLMGAAALKIPVEAATVALALCAAWSLVGPKQAIQAMALSTLIGYANPALIVLDPASGVLVRLVLLLSAIRVLPTLAVAEMRILWPICAFSLFAALSSAAVSPSVPISTMKVITFLIGSSTAVVAFAKLTPHQIHQTRTWLISLVCVVVLLSALTLVSPAVAYFRTGTGLQGILNHPQSLGTLLAPFAAWWLVGTLLSRERLNMATAAITVGTLVVMLLTHARTALIATSLGLAATVLTRIYGRRRSSQGSASKAAGILAVSVLGLVVAQLMGGDVVAVSKGFMLKRTEDTNVSQAFLDSRGDGIASEWQNFLSAPLTGHGFGVYADGSFPSGVVTFDGIPISAPAEKGFVPTAVLEETGLPGGLLLYFSIFWLARQVWRCDDLRWIAMFVAAIGINTGEAVIMSPGGIGLFIWLIIGLTCCGFKADEAQPYSTGSLASAHDVEMPPQASPYNIMRRSALLPAGLEVTGTS